MTDHQQQLEQLKQQLYAKIQVTQTQEPLSDGDLLKYSELPICQKHQILHHQIKQRSMDEKRARYSPATSEALEQIAQSLKTALNALENAHALMMSSELDKSHHELYVSVCDAMTAIEEGCARLVDGVDE